MGKMISKKVSLLLVILLLSITTLSGCKSSENGDVHTSKSNSDTTVSKESSNTNETTDTKDTSTDTNNASANTKSISSDTTNIVIAAAASLQYSLENELIPMFEKENQGITVEGTYDSSGKLQTQIEEGLAADIFFSAATKQMDTLNDKGYIKADSKLDLLKNKIVLIVPSDSTYNLAKFEDIATVKRIAIGDPESVPAGQYAKEALTNLGIWDEVSAKSSLGTNVTEVLKWVSEASADAGIVYATDAVASPDGIKVIAEAPSGSLKTDVVYPVAVLNNSSKQDAANKFIKFLSSDEAIAVFEKYGFTDNTK